MILFLDVISPFPKFVMIDNNKVIESLHILDQNHQKISDGIYNKFLILQEKHNLLKTLKSLIVCTGPGSFTGLRVGISFMFGLSYSKEIPIYGLTCIELFNQFIVKKNFYRTLIAICSSNNQYFVCLPYHYKDYQYKIIKINDISSFDNIDLKKYSKCISNHILPDFMNQFLITNIGKIEYINLENKLHDLLLTNLDKTTILQPVYISDNKLFDTSSYINYGKSK